MWCILVHIIISSLRSLNTSRASSDTTEHYYLEHPAAKILPHLADPAALLVAILVEGEQALRADQIHCLLRVREGVLDANAIMLLNVVK